MINFTPEGLAAEFFELFARYAPPDKRAALDRDFLDFATRSNQGPPGGPAEYPYEYLLVVGRKRE
jgi:hypothetical protein